jgi:hypothetical protein
MIKLLIVGRGRVGMPPAEQRRYMLEVHGSSVVALIASDPDVAPRRYVQNHVSASVPDTESGPLRDFVTQVWFDDPDQMHAALSAPRYVQELQPDEDRFVDQSSVVVLPVEETVLLEPAEGATVKVFLLLDAGGRSRELGWEAVVERTEGIRGLVANRVVRTGCPYDVVYESWFDDFDAAGAAARSWHEQADAEQVPDLLLATEHVLHAGPDRNSRR